jgi:DNA polymerase-3 subunit alpha
MAIIVLDDGNARVEVTVFNELFEQHRHWLKEDQLLIVEGEVANDEFSGGLRVSAKNVFDLQSARTRYARGIRITCNGASSGAKLRELLGPYRSGRCPVEIVYYNKGATCEIELGDDWRVNPQDDLIQSLEAWVKGGNVQIIYGGSAAYSS